MFAIPYRRSQTMHTAFYFGAASLVIWIYLLCARGGFWRIELPARNRRAMPMRIVAVVPARNEADVIFRSVTSLLKQMNGSLQVIVVDDASEDDTANVVKKAAADVGAGARLQVLTGSPLPQGWSGKLWAVQQGIEAAEKSDPDYLLLTDADIEHGPDNVSRLAGIAAENEADLASYMVKLHCDTLAEKLLIPAFVFFFFKLYPPRWISNSKNKTAGAAGGCMLIRPAALKLAGGIQGIRGEIIDDCALASQIKQSGGKVWLGLTDSAASIRPYETFSEIGRMISRSAFNQLHHSTWLLMVSVVGLILTYVAPIGVLFSNNKVAAIAGGIALALMMIAYAPMVRFYQLNPLWTLALPLSAIFYMGATLHSAINYWAGRGGRWKGRVQDRSEAASP
jgi:hopene-associated glycosyltransferase HpnB